MTVNISAVLALLCFLFYIVYTRIVDSGHLLRLPPGPKQLPLLGNIHQISLNDQAALFAEWGKKYGDVVYVRLFQRPVVILNSLQAAQDLLEKRGSKYSDRPPFILAEDIYNFKPVTAFMSTGEEWRRHRKWFQAAFETKNALDHYRPLQRREVNKLLSDLIQNPVAFVLHIERFISKVVYRLNGSDIPEFSCIRYPGGQSGPSELIRLLLTPEQSRRRSDVISGYSGLLGCASQAIQKFRTCEIANMYYSTTECGQKT